MKEEEKMSGLSVIVCSVDPEKSETLKENIAATIGEGVNYEILIHDNYEGIPLAKVYNMLAGNTCYDNLLFIHEDAGFVSRDWYREISPQLARPDCGVIGFAGAVIMASAPAGWAQSQEYNRVNLIERGTVCRVNMEAELDFTEVVTLDGFAMFVRREVWESNPFDERHLKGFHCYDIDFTLGMGSEFHHYVSNRVRIRHDSSGTYDRKWLEATMDLYSSKWKALLPRKVVGLDISGRQMRKEGERVSFRTLRRMAKLGIYSRRLERDFLGRGFSLRHLGHLLKWIPMKFRQLR
ncbi:MAG: glycosyltransferase family protein [Muribaculaceae bacterium]|nr:glycosyltransferase family protein [Muribaculaceae bacterium]